MAGFAGLSEAERKPITAALSAALVQVFPAYALTPARIEKSFSDAVSLCRALRSEDGRRYRRVGMLSPLHLDTPVHAHMMPVEPPDTDIANDAHEPWASIWTPDQVRRDSFDDLFGPRHRPLRGADAMRHRRDAWACILCFSPVCAWRVEL